MDIEALRKRANAHGRRLVMIHRTAPALNIPNKDMDEGPKGRKDAEVAGMIQDGMKYYLLTDQPLEAWFQTVPEGPTGGMAFTVEQCVI